MITLEIGPDFDWQAPQGKALNLILNIMGGLAVEDLSKEEMECLQEAGYFND